MKQAQWKIEVLKNRESSKKYPSNCLKFSCWLVGWTLFNEHRLKCLRQAAIVNQMDFGN